MSNPIQLEIGEGKVLAKKPYNFEDITTAVGHKFGHTLCQVKRCRNAQNRGTARTRCAMIYAVKRITGARSHELADSAKFDRGSSAIRMALKKAKGLMETDAKFAEEINSVINTFERRAVA